MKNAKNVKSKSSKVMHVMNKFLYSVFIFEISLCVLFGYLSLIWEERVKNIYTYIYKEVEEENRFVKFLTNTMTFFVLYANMIPISLYVVLEIIKSIQGLLISHDLEIYDESIDKKANCRTTELIEELGQVEFIFSDKTGTLTQNSMVLKQIYVNGKVYGNKIDSSIGTKFAINGDLKIDKKLRSKLPEDEKGKKKIENFLYILSVCHDIFPEEDESEIIYQDSSPDEVSLVKGASLLGFTYKSKIKGVLTIEDEIKGTERHYEIKMMIPFDSYRKRMGIIIYNQEENKYESFIKGTGYVVNKIIKFKKNEKDEIKRINSILSHKGLRILMITKKTLKEEDVKLYLVTLKNIKNEKDELDKLYNQIEKNVKFCGTSAIEDEL